MLQYFYLYKRGWASVSDFKLESQMLMVISTQVHKAFVKRALNTAMEKLPVFNITIVTLKNNFEITTFSSSGYASSR